MRPRRMTKGGKALMILLCVAAFISLFSFIVMSLWNAILPEVLNVNAINFWQAMGILVLSKILFGGFGGWGNKKQAWKQKMQEKWEHMTPEERNRFQESFKSRFGRRWCQPDDRKETTPKGTNTTSQPDATNS